MNLNTFYALDIVLVCGLPLSGKSHFAKKFFINDNRKRINRKEIRRLIYEMTNFGKAYTEEAFDDHDEFLVKHVERKILEHMLQEKKKVLIDNTSVSRESRSTYITAAKHLAKSIGVIFLNTALQECLKRNQASAEKVPDAVITNLYTSINLPEKKEGFKEILIINNYSS